eukprot:12899506-Prorocentrum_lima.AAC.1
MDLPGGLLPLRILRAFKVQCKHLGPRALEPKMVYSTAVCGAWCTMATWTRINPTQCGCGCGCGRGCG